MPRVDIIFLSDTGFGDKKAYMITVKKPEVGMYIVLPTCAVLQITKVKELPHGVFGKSYAITTTLTKAMFHRLRYKPDPITILPWLRPYKAALASEWMDVIQCQCTSQCLKFIHLNGYTLKKLVEAKLRIVSPECTTRETARKVFSGPDYIAYRK